MKQQALLVYDEALRELDRCEFYIWLKEKGFVLDTNNFKRGYPYWSCPWVHIDLTQKKFAFGMPGVELFEPIGGHAITVEEFKLLFEIFEKYRGKSVLEF